MTNLLDKIIEVIKQAGEIVLTANTTDGRVSSKEGSANFVTEYDIYIESFLRNELTRISSETVFIGEESEQGIHDIRHGSFFIVDPIDGTMNFIREYKHSAISIGLCTDGEMISGAVYNPYLNELFYASKGEGAFMNGRRISVSNKSLADSLVAFGTTPYSREYAGATFDFASRLYMKSCDIRRSGSAALDICGVAAGKTDLFFEFSLSPWDYAAASLILKEAGGIITSFDGLPLSLEKPSSVLAGNKTTYDESLQLYHLI